MEKNINLLGEQMKKHLNLTALAFAAVLLSPLAALAQPETTVDAGRGLIALGAGLGVALAALGGALGQGKVVSAALEAIGRNPAAGGKMLTPMVLGLVFIETLVIFTFVIAFFLNGHI